MQSNVKVIARFAIIAALVVTAVLLDTAISVGFTALGIPKVAWVVLIVVLTVIQQFGFGTALFTGAAFGVTSFIMAYIMPTSLVSPLFQNPLISVLPRVMIGITSYWTLRLMKLITRNSENLFVSKLLPSSVAGAVGVLTNTVLVLSMMALMSGDSAVAKIAGVLLSVNFIPEIAIGLLVIPTLSTVLGKQIRKMSI